MAGFAERFRNEGMQQGEVQALKKLVQLKFGQLPDWAEEQINTASLEQLETWIERILTAENLEDLLNQ